MSDDEAPKFPDTAPNELVIGTSTGRVLVRINQDGNLEYGPDYTPDAAAKEFWEHMAKRRKDYEERLVFLTHVENLLSRVGEQDLKVEVARTRAEADNATPDEQFRAEMAMGQLQVLWHELVEFSRGVALRDRHNKKQVVEPMIPTDPSTKRILH